MTFYFFRLSSKKSVPNVAVRKQEFERVGKDEVQAVDRDESCSPSRDNFGLLSGNRTVIVGSKQIHVEPPTDFRQLTPGKLLFYIHFSLVLVT